MPYPAASGRRLLTPAERPDGADGADGLEGSVVSLQDLSGAVVVLTSPSALRELSRQLAGGREGSGQPADVRFVAIGQPTRRAAENGGIYLVGSSASPDASGLLEVLDVLDGQQAPRLR